MPTIIDAFELRATASSAERSAMRVEEDRLQASPDESAREEMVGIQGLALFLLDAIVLWLVLAQLLYLVACPPGLNGEILKIIGRPGNPLAHDISVTIDADYECQYKYIVKAISRCTGRYDPTTQQVTRYVEKIKFAPAHLPKG